MPCDCPHADAPEFGRVCVHLLATGPAAYWEHFTGEGKESWLVCPACRRTPALRRACRACWDAIRGREWEGTAGTPRPLLRASPLRFVQERRRIPGADTAHYLVLRPLVRHDAQAYIALTTQGDLYRIDLDADEALHVGTVADMGVMRFGMGDLLLSADGRFGAVFNPAGQHGAVFDLTTSRVTMRLDRGGHEIDRCAWPLAFFEHRGRTLLVHASEWNRLEVSDPRDGAMLTHRVDTFDHRGRSMHYLDYHHCGLAVSPDQRRIADNGWFPEDRGSVRAWSLTRWMEEDVWESERSPDEGVDGPREGVWDAPLCWLDGRRLAVWGYGATPPFIDGVRVIDVEAGRETHWFPGPNGPLVFDEWLFSLHSGGVTVWDVDTGERLLDGPPPGATVYHPGAKTFLAWDAEGEAVLSRLTGHPRPAWPAGDALSVARAIAEGRDWAALPILADALEDAGCDDAPILKHLREGAPHGRGCWAVRRLLEA